MSKCTFTRVRRVEDAMLRGLGAGNAGPRQPRNPSPSAIQDFAPLSDRERGLAEALALGAVVGLTLALRSDVAAALVGVVVVAVLRWAGV